MKDGQFVTLVRTTDCDGKTVINHFWASTHREQMDHVMQILSSVQRHSAVDTNRRVICAIPDPYRAKQTLEEFLAHYLPHDPANTKTL